MLNNAEASREIRRLFYEQWVLRVGALNLTRRGSIVTYIPTVKWEEIEETDLNDNGAHWCHFKLRNVKTAQHSLAGNRIEEIGTIYNTVGIASVDMFFSKSAYKTNDKDAIEEIAQSIFFKQSTPGGVWFRNPTIYQLNPEVNFFRSMVTAEYVFDSMVQ